TFSARSLNPHCGTNRLLWNPHGFVFASTIAINPPCVYSGDCFTSLHANALFRHRSYYITLVLHPSNGLYPFIASPPIMHLSTVAKLHSKINPQSEFHNRFT